MRAFDHHYLDVYWRAVATAAEVYRLTRGAPRDVYPLTDQAFRAATSVSLNIAEGAGEFSAREKSRFYRIARRSAAETSSALDLLVALTILAASQTTEAQQALREIGAMLTGMIKTQARRSRGGPGSSRTREENREPPGTSANHPPLS